MELRDRVDWSKFKGTPPTVYCRCEAVFRSYAKYFYEGGVPRGTTQIPCPSCGEYEQIRRVSYDPEMMTISNK